MRRLKLTEDEAAIIEGLRHEKAIWNNAIAEAISILLSATEVTTRDEIASKMMEARKL